MTPTMMYALSSAFWCFLIALIYFDWKFLAIFLIAIAAFGMAILAFEELTKNKSKE